MTLLTAEEHCNMLINATFVPSGYGGSPTGSRETSICASSPVFCEFESFFKAGASADEQEGNRVQEVLDVKININLTDPSGKQKNNSLPLAIRLYTYILFIQKTFLSKIPTNKRE